MKRVLITGGGKGIGREIVRTLAADGYDIDFTYRLSSATAKALLAELVQAYPNQSFRAHPADLADRASVEALANDIMGWEGLFAFVHNAGATYDALTATASIEGDRNGVFCYGTSCGLPTESYKDTNYWVTPLLWKHNFGGYQQPIDTAVVNTVKAGRAIPVKFSLGGDKGLDIVRAGHPKVTEVACEAGVVTDPVEETVTSDLNTLKYNASADTYTYVWKTKKSWSGSCVEFELGLNDWSSHVFTVKFA